MNAPLLRDPVERLLACLQLALGHELPNRLTAMQGLLRVLELETADKLDAEQRDFLKRVATQARRSQLLANELAVLIRLLRTPQRTDSVNLPEMIAEIAAEVKQLFPFVNIEYHIPADFPVLRVSILGLRQVLTGLVKTLLQSSGSNGSSRIEIRGNQEATGWRLTLSDNGPGLAEDQLVRLFEPFAFPPASEADTGLGLFSFRYLVESWGGAVTVESAPGQGTTFTITGKEP